MRWLYRAVLSLVLVAALVLAFESVIGTVLRLSRPVRPESPTPLPVPAGDQEIAFLYPATSTVNWERFVTAIRKLTASDATSQWRIADERQAFPSQTAAVPEIAIAHRQGEGRLWFRWYKLTGDWDTKQWVTALTRRSTPPLAIIGGGSSDRAYELARHLRQLPQSDQRPLLLITTATADEVEFGSPLMNVYPRRSFRFCFTNRQMAEAVTDFIWTQKDLRPDRDPVYFMSWLDDPYSEDLRQRFLHVLSQPHYGGMLRQNGLARDAGRLWASLASQVSSKVPVVTLGGMHRFASRQGESAHTFLHLRSPYSVGSFDEPNRHEAEAAEMLVAELRAHPEQQRPLLILPAVPEPARRFLRTLVRLSPQDAGKLVVATGDSIDFNTVYRDQLVKWHIQDLPCVLVLFCHHNPVDRIGFVPEPDATAKPDLESRSATGTQDLLLYLNIVQTITQAVWKQNSMLQDADALRDELAKARLFDGRKRFDEHGNQRSGAGEYVVCLRPIREDQRVLPLANLQVWNRSTDADGVERWRQVSELIVKYRQKYRHR